ncbi:nuclear pore complex NUP54 [Olea europaea subsp. europaea]|uniref:Nuclear pore complex NUP54 n=1 Tax=Olea europaea subsp. europaea TaxID=158383 RepID=A0A8S0R4P2_OLEEU|nr:nuclear pore complex NUP54 [Olea europaea subsp. europaea]
MERQPAGHGNDINSPGIKIIWAEVMGKLEGMESSNLEHLWPQLVQGFKDLSTRLKVN